MSTRARLLRGRVPLGELLDRLAAVHGGDRLVEQDSPVGLTGTRVLSFEEAADVVARASGVLASRCAGGRRVVLRGPNDYGFFLACLAVSRAGGVVVPVNPRMRDEEVDHVVEDADAAVVELEWLADRLERSDAGRVPAVAPGDDVAGIFYTSGTTGQPKGARLSHAALVEPASWGALWPSGLRRDELVFSLPIAHIMGLASLVAAAGAGIPVFSIPRFSPSAVLDAIEERRATVFVGVPAMYRMLLEAGAEQRDLRSVRLWASAADVMPAELARRFKRMGATATLPVLGRSVGEAAFAQGYGMVELGGAATAKISPPGVGLGLGDLLGLSVFGTRMRVVDDTDREVGRGEVGELLVKSPAVLRGYHGKPDATREILTEDGWVRTGDLARKGRLGAARFAGRKKDVVMHGGYSVYPAEVEEVLGRHEAVAEVAVVGCPDRVKGEVPVAFVRIGGDRSVAEEDLLAFATAHLADYKVPVEVRFVEDLPRTGTGKVHKPELRERLAGT